MKRLILLTMAVALALTGCRSPQPTSAPLSLPTPSSAPSETPPPAPTPSPSPQPSATPAPTLGPTSAPTRAPDQDEDVSDHEEFVFSEYSLLAVYYDPLAWIPDKGLGQGFLESAAVPGCQVSDQPASEPPLNTKNIQIGAFRFQTATTENPTTHERIEWLLLQNNLPTPYLEQNITPIFVIFAPAAQADACITEAHKVLATLHESPQ